MSSNLSGGGASDGVVQIGIVGLGAAARPFIPAILAHPGFRLAAIAESDADVRTSVIAEHGIPGYATIEAMLEHPELEAVYIATPTELHAEHVALACAAGKHVLVEKPMATSLEQARAMIACAARAGVMLLVGHSHSYDLPIQRMREIIAGGSLGRVRMVNTWYYTDWVYRPRRPEELDVTKGGGVTYRQGSHQFDIIRLLCGGMAKSVRARTFDWDPGRRTTGAHIVFIDFEDGAAATAIYNGYGHFSTRELGFDMSEWGYPMPPESPKPPQRGMTEPSPQDELRAKQLRARNAIPGSAPFQPFFGLTLVSCERGDIRQSPGGLYVYSDQGRAEIMLTPDRSPHRLVIAEFYDALKARRQALHDGRWGLANLEVCTAAIVSSASGRDVILTEQVSVPA